MDERVSPQNYRNRHHVSAPGIRWHPDTPSGELGAWGLGLAQHSTDRLFAVKGLVLIVVFHARESSPTHGQVNEFKLSGRSPATVPVAEFSPGSADERRMGLSLTGIHLDPSADSGDRVVRGLRCGASSGIAAPFRSAPG